MTVSSVTTGAQACFPRGDQQTRRRNLTVYTDLRRLRAHGLMMEVAEPHRFAAIVRDDARLPASDDEDTAPT